MAQDDPEIMAYLPDEPFENPKFRCNRTFIETIVNTVRPEYVKKLVTHARQTRINILHPSGPAAERTVSIAPEFAKILNETKFEPLA